MSFEAQAVVYAVHKCSLVDFVLSAKIHLAFLGISVCRKLCNPWHSFLRYPTVPFVWGIRKFNLTPPKLRKIEAIQTSLFVDVLNAFSAMIGPTTCSDSLQNRTTSTTSLATRRHRRRGSLLS